MIDFGSRQTLVNGSRSAGGFPFGGSAGWAVAFSPLLSIELP